jgi:glutathione S-transferase
VLLYDSGVSGNCYKVRLLLAHLGLEYERQELSVTDRSDRADVIGRELNPDLRVPTIVLDDGRPIAESNAIMWFFADGTPYLPTDRYERAQVLQWLFFEQYSHEPKIAVLRFWTHYDSKPHTDAETAPLRAAGHNALAAMDGHLEGREFFVGAAYSIADIALYAYTHNAPETGFELGPNVQAWLERVRSQPGHVQLTD